MRIENLLRSAGVQEDLLYKPDIFSTLGIYRNNIWGFRPTIYSSTVMKTLGKSRVTLAGTGGFFWSFEFIIKSNIQASPISTLVKASMFDAD